MNSFWMENMSHHSENFYEFLWNVGQVGDTSDILDQEDCMPYGWISNGLFLCVLLGLLRPSSSLLHKRGRRFKNQRSRVSSWTIMTTSPVSFQRNSSCLGSWLSPFIVHKNVFVKNFSSNIHDPCTDISMTMTLKSTSPMSPVLVTLLITTPKLLKG